MWTKCNEYPILAQKLKITDLGVITSAPPMMSFFQVSLMFTPLVRKGYHGDSKNIGVQSSPEGGGARVYLAHILKVYNFMKHSALQKFRNKTIFLEK